MLDGSLSDVRPLGVLAMENSQNVLVSLCNRMPTMIL